MISIKFKRLHPDAMVPQKANKTDAGWDIYALENTVVFPGQTAIVRTGFSLEIPEGYELQIRSRSGMAFKLNTVVANGVGTIDTDYRGEIGVLMWNRNKTPVELIKGSKIAQFVIGKVYEADFVETDDLTETKRGSGGFGSTGR